MADHYGALGKSDVKYAIKALYADRAYDRHKLYKLCDECGIKTKIPPKNNAAEHLKLDYMLDSLLLPTNVNGLINKVLQY
ncbi:hypothetical protein NOX90_07150 [Wolbachia endosymbiont of Anurida maritima]|uniref:hypothetical protein n=1 Tax=Wolbachia endosymbiont of Anurida maritima TaxID=2850562 RepID=UPI0035CEEB0E